MNKELFVSSTPHETKVGIVEEDQLAEIYFERENEYTLAGSIYKGRVTRVLPGMQSAFVDLGLERDAFLYVTDFLEEQEDVEEFDQVVTQAHDRAAKGGDNGQQQAPPARPIEAEEALADEPMPRGERQPLSNAATIEEAGGDVVRPDVDGNRDEERGGNRRFRRRRRGRRGRGGPGREAQPGEQGNDQPRREPQGEPEPAEAQAGESLNPEEHFNREENYVRPDFEARQEQPREERGPREDRGAREQRFGGRDRDRGRDRGRGRDRDRGGRDGRDRDRDRGGRPANYQPIVLPGESISKYRNIQPLPGETLSRPVQPEGHAAFAEQREAVERESTVDDTQVQTVYTPPVHVAEETHQAPRERFAQMNVAATFGGDETTEAEEPTSRDEVPYERPDREERSERRDDDERREAAAPPHAYGTGVVEEEEIEDEEMDLGGEEELEEGEFEELEEEELEAEDGGEELIAAGSEVTEAVRDAHVVDRATGHYESNGIAEGEEEREEEDEGTDFEEVESSEGEPPEMIAEGELYERPDVSEAGEQEEGEPDRAELRGPAGTAGLQRAEREQRGERRGDRGDRFQRGGRRGRRGRGRPQRGGGRRNIQSAGRPAINELLKEGQEILVQIAKEPMGKKGARITSHIALPGRFLVYMPTVAHIGVSRKIGSDEERRRLKHILLSEREATKAHGGFIVRTAAAGAHEEELRADIRFLVNLWNEIKQRAESSKAPSLIYHDLNLVERVLRDQVTQNFSAIWVDNEAEYERVLRFIGRFQPSLVKRVKLYTKESPLFESFGIQEEINKALKSKVWLKSGGYIVINQTEALVAIDVNTGKYVGKTGRLEDTIVKTNVDAIKEIVRQIRLRDLGGIIVIDFIDMDERRNRQKVMQALEEALRSDRAPSKVLQFNDFGLVAITRKRVKQSLERTLGMPCTYCTGTGLIKSVTTVCNEIYVEMRKMAKTIDKSDIMLRVNPEVAKQLKANQAKWLSEMEELTGRTVIVRNDPTLHQEQFDIQ